MHIPSLLRHPSSQRVVYVTYWLLSWFGFFLVPYFGYLIRRNRVGDDFDERAAEDSKELDNMVTYRDLGFEIWTNAHGHMVKDTLAYMSYMFFVYIINFALWYAYYTYQAWKEYNAVLVTAMIMLSGMELVMNSMSQFPPPPGYLQNEPVVISSIMGCVTHDGHGMLSGRTAFSFLLMHDMLYVQWPTRVAVRRFLVLLYCVIVLGFLWASHQMYTASLVMNLMAAVAVHHMSKAFATPMKNHMRELMGLQRGIPSTGGTFEIGISDEEDEDDDAGAGSGGAKEMHTVEFTPPASRNTGAVEIDMDPPYMDPTDESSRVPKSPRKKRKKSKKQNGADDTEVEDLL